MIVVPVTFTTRRESQPANQKSRALDGIENMQVFFKRFSKAGRSREIGMGSDHESIPGGALPDFLQRTKVFRASVKIICKNVALPVRGYFHARDQSNSAVTGVVGKILSPYIPVVTGDCQNGIAELYRGLYQLFGRMPANPVILGIKAAVGMQFRFQPASPRMNIAVKTHVSPAKIVNLPAPCLSADTPH